MHLRSTLALIILLEVGLSGCSSGQGRSDPGAVQPPLAVSYTQHIQDSTVHFDMVFIPGGPFAMGSGSDEPGRRPDEGPRSSLRVEPLWMGRCEVTWDEYDLWAKQAEPIPGNKSRSTSPDKADAVSWPSPPYVSLDRSMGHAGGYPAISMSQFAARHYTRWLTKKTGHFYRLATEAEWEYACRAGTTTAYAFGDDPLILQEHAWYRDNSEETYHKVGQKKPNPWGLYDMHGNVAEWVLDQYVPDAYGRRQSKAAHDPILWPTTTYPRVVRGGSWADEPESLRSAGRGQSHKDWNQTDPNLPRSIWYLRDAPWVGFRVVRPLHAPGADEQEKYWAPDTDEAREIYLEQRKLREMD